MSLWPKISLAEKASITGKSHKLLSPLDEAISEFMDANSVHGASVAVSRNGKLVYARGFGYQDDEKQQAVEPGTLFRIASISKPITAVAVLQLVQKKAVSLDDRVVDILELGKASDQRWEKITVRHLLHHTGGWDSKVSFDPMFHARQIRREIGASFPIQHHQIIQFMMKQPLDSEPGVRYAYSNFGYCLLGRILEKLSGESYGECVSRAVMKPLGITRARLGKTLLSSRHEGETMYFDERERTGTCVVEETEQQFPWPYGVWDLESMDSHGGWIASAADLVRFAVDFDVPRKSKLLSVNLVNEMFSFPSYPVDGHTSELAYGLGWQVRKVGPDKVNAWHTGRLDGTASLLVRRHDGLNWAVVFNSDANPSGKYLAGLVDPLMHEWVNRIRQWPDHNLFSEVLRNKTSS